MQKVCAAPGGVKGYLADPDGLVTPETRTCPFCPDEHRLWLHGWYERFALLPDPEPAVKVPIRRLLCPATGRTVSLLPDFCIPRRQHGPGILGPLLQGWALQGKPLLGALQAVRRDGAWHSVVQSLLRGFLRRIHALRSYLAGVRHRSIGPPASIVGPRRPVAAVVMGLVVGFPDVAAAFVHHGRAFHALCGEALA